MNTFGEKIAFGGAPQIDPAQIVGLPPDALGVKMRQRVGKAVIAFVRTPHGISSHYLFVTALNSNIGGELRGMFKLGFPLGRNTRRKL